MFPKSALMRCWQKNGGISFPSYAFANCTICIGERIPCQSKPILVIFGNLGKVKTFPFIYVSSRDRNGVCWIGLEWIAFYLILLGYICSFSALFIECIGSFLPFFLGALDFFALFLGCIGALLPFFSGALECRLARGGLSSSSALRSRRQLDF